MLIIKDLVIEHQKSPLGIDCKIPRFGWKLISEENEVFQTAYQIELFKDGKTEANSGKVDSENSMDVVVEGWETSPMVEYSVKVTVWDNKGSKGSIESFFETGRLGVPFQSSWVEPEQEPTPSSLCGTDRSLTENPYASTERDYSEFRPSQYIRIPFSINKKIKKSRIYATAHGVYRLEVNGQRPDDRELAPEFTSYDRMLQYQTYDVTNMLQADENVIGVILADGWWAGRVGTSGDSCQYGNKVGLLLEGVIFYEDGTEETISCENGVSSTGPIIFSDLFVGEKYDATKEMEGWNAPGFDDSNWHPVKKADYPKDVLIGQYDPPVRPLTSFTPKEILHSPKGEVIIDAGQVLAGVVEFTVQANAGVKITLEHSEVLDKEGNYFNNILGVNKEQTDIYITRDGLQSYRPHFTYHGFRYVRITGWPGEISAEQFKIIVLSSDMADTGSFETSDERINQLQRNIWWSQVSNSVSIPTDCPQREKAGWTGDIMAYAPTMCFNRNANAFLTKWMTDVRAAQLDNGAIPMIVPYLKAYELFIKGEHGSDTSCGWGDAVIIVPYAMYRAYGDLRILEENYDAMERWMAYIQNRAQNHHPDGYESWKAERKERSKYLWNTDFHFGDWLIPSMVLGNPDGGAMIETAYATMGIVAPAYYAFSAKHMAEISRILGKEDAAIRYEALYQNIREAFITEYVHSDGTLDADFQGIYVIALKNNLVTDEIRPKMVEHLCSMIRKNKNCLDTGFLSVLFLMDVLCENGKRDVAYQLMFQTDCPSWLYAVEHGATTMWESWGAVLEDGTVSTYSYNHYAFGCVGNWMYREMGGLQAQAPGYKKIRIAPALDCGLSWAKASKDTPYGEASVHWEISGSKAEVRITIPANTSAEIKLPGLEVPYVGSGVHSFSCDL